MVESGILTDDDPVELLEGWLVVKMPKNPPHRIATRKTRRALERVVSEDWYVDSQEPITTVTSEPEPDVSVVRGDTEQYRAAHPRPADVGLVAEVADKSLKRDRQLKRRIYADARLVVYWIVNLVQRQIEVYSKPKGKGKTATYARKQIYRENSSVPVVLDGEVVAHIPVADCLP
jgi:Uma2 family endonuclease